MRPSRRAFVKTLAGGASTIAAARYGSSTITHGAAASDVAAQESFRGSKAGDERVVDGIRLCWCPAGKFLMGSPATERGHRPDEAQVEVTLTKGFWTAKHEATQGQWKRVIGAFPDKLPSAA